MIRTLLLAGVIAGAGAFGTVAAGSPAAPATDGGQLSKQDKDFVNEAAMGGLLEVKLGELAGSRAADADVKKFGQRMVDDHTKLNQRFAQLAGQKGLTLPDKLDKKAQGRLDDLAKLNGARFDKEYMADMVADHEHDVAAFEKEAKDAKDADLAALVTSALPTLHDHLTLAKQVEAKAAGEK
jgi:putative membrane protein